MQTERTPEQIEARRKSQREASARYRAKNPHVGKAWRDANRDKLNAATTAWRQRNPEKYNSTVQARREKDREPSRKAALKWQQNNMPAKIAMNRARQAAKLGATPPWITREHRKQMRAMYIEAARLSEETGDPYHVDHIHALRGDGFCGLHVPWNLQVITADENLKKGNKLAA